MLKLYAVHLMSMTHSKRLYFKKLINISWYILAKIIWIFNFLNPTLFRIDWNNFSQDENLQIIIMIIKRMSNIYGSKQYLNIIYLRNCLVVSCWFALKFFKQKLICRKYEQKNICGLAGDYKAIRSWSCVHRLCTYNKCKRNWIIHFTLCV